MQYLDEEGTISISESLNSEGDINIGCYNFHKTGTIEDMVHSFTLNRSGSIKLIKLLTDVYNL